MHRMPPTLILHGEADRSHHSDIRSASPRRLADELTVPHETVIYPGLGHGLPGVDAQRDALRRSLHFTSAAIFAQSQSGTSPRFKINALGIKHPFDILWSWR